MACAICSDHGEESAALHVLLAEDNVINQKLASKLLERRGHHVTIAASGHAALELLAREDFDVVLMDVQMPDMDGMEATRAIRAREPLGVHIPIAALTARTMTEIANAASPPAWMRSSPSRSTWRSLSVPWKSWEGARGFLTARRLRLSLPARHHLLHPASEVRHHAHHPFQHHQLRAMMHLVLLDAQQHLEARLAGRIA